MSIFLWSLLASLLVVAEDGRAYGEDYAIFWIGRNPDGSISENSYLGGDYLTPNWDNKSQLNQPPKSPHPTRQWLFWDASSVRFKMGFLSSDFSSLAPMTSAIQSAIASWDAIDAGQNAQNALSITYGGADIYRSNNPNDGVNTIFWSNHSTISHGNGFTLITASISGDSIGEFSDVDIVLNDGRQWTIGTSRCGTDTVDVQSVVTHELGHALGLAHSTGPNTMTSSTSWCRDHADAYEAGGQRTLTNNDKDGYRYIYVNTTGVRATFGRDGQSSQKIVVGDVPKENGATETTVFPNPFNPEVTVTFDLEHSASVGVRIYNELGQQVRVLAAEALRPAGHYQFVWDGRDQVGQFQASGTYFLVLLVDGAIETRKLTLLH